MSLTTPPSEATGMTSRRLITSILDTLDFTLDPTDRLEEARRQSLRAAAEIRRGQQAKKTRQQAQQAALVNLLLQLQESSSSCPRGRHQK